MGNLSLFYDGRCILCAKEIEHYQKVDVDKKVKLVDISDDNFDAAKYNLDARRVQKYFHVKDKSGKIVTGVEAFYLIWVELNIFKPLQVLYKTPVIKQSMSLCYFLFAQVRPYLPKKEKCHDGSCDFR